MKRTDNNTVLGSMVERKSLKEKVWAEMNPIENKDMIIPLKIRPFLPIY